MIPLYDHPRCSFATHFTLPHPSYLQQPHAPFFLSFYDVILYRSLGTTLLCRASLSAKRKRQPNDRWQPLQLFPAAVRLVGSPTVEVAWTFLRRRIDAPRQTSPNLFTVPAGFLVGVDSCTRTTKERERETGVNDRRERVGRGVNVAKLVPITGGDLQTGRSFTFGC